MTIPFVPNLYEFISSFEYKRRYFDTKQLTVATDFQIIIFFHTMEAINSLVTNILQNIFLCVLQLKEIHTSLGHHEGE